MKLRIITATTIGLLAISATSQAEPDKKTITPATPKTGDTSTWHNLLADNNLSQWKSLKKDDIANAPAWSVKDGVLHLDKPGQGKSRGGSIITLKQYFNFEFKFEFKISAKGNSGVKYRSLNNLGLEYQVLDDLAASDNKNAKNRASSLYQLVAAPDTKTLKPVGEWNTGRIIANGKHLEHWLNGEKVVEIEMDSEAWKEAFAKSKYKSKPNFAKEGGEILLQDHGDIVSYRNLLIKELK